MTIVEKILAEHSGRRSVAPGEFISVKTDFVFGNEQTGELAIQELQKLGNPRVFDPGKVAIIADHFLPCRDVHTAEQVKVDREFARNQGIIFLEAGRPGAGIEHIILPEQGYILPGQVIVGGDSHTCTYGALGALATGMGSTDIAVAMARGTVWMKVPHTLKFTYTGTLPEWVGGKDLILNTIGDIGVDGAMYAAMEFGGDAVDRLEMDGRFTMANMAIEAGAKAGIFRVDVKTRDYLAAHAPGAQYEEVEPDEDAEYAACYEYDVTNMEPVVAFPPLPSNVRPVSEAGGIEIDQVVIGLCTNGRMDDLRTAARVLNGRRIHPHVRCLVFPGSQAVYLQAMREGLLEIFVEAGAAVSTPTCGPCLGGHMGILASGERCVSTSNRNFIGRMGSLTSEVYLANPAVAAASAIAGRIASPQEVVA